GGDEGLKDPDRAPEAEAASRRRLRFAPPGRRCPAHGRLQAQGLRPPAAKSRGMAVADARFAPPATPPFEHLVLDFLAYLEFERGLSRNTLEAYRSDLLQYGAHLAGKDPLAVTHSDLAAFIDVLATGDG